jgi:Asp-tRNA(Asn)/Glu-tRNA(Gln) amidotransferase A subunit family amidase
VRAALLVAGLLLATPLAARAEDARLCLTVLAMPWDERDLAAAHRGAGDALRQALTRSPTGFRAVVNRDDTLTIAGLACALHEGAVLADAEILLCRYRGELRQPRQ